MNLDDLESSTLFNCQFCGKPPWNTDGRLKLDQACCEDHENKLIAEEAQRERDHDAWLERSTETYTLEEEMHVSEYLPIEDLVTGKAYKVYARNFSVAIWDGKQFQGLRQKFSHYFMDQEDHWDAGPPHGTVKPLRLLE